ncbi:hypothetical protein ACSBR1_009730 [Camellia fascicularis]
MKNDYGLEISYQVAWLGVEKARGLIYGDHAMLFDQLRCYSDANFGRFVRYFISFRACIDGFNQCHPLLFLDETFLKG